MTHLRNKTVVLTGAAGGLGRYIANELVEERAKIVAVDISPQGLEDLKSEIEMRGGDCVTIPFNLSQIEFLGDLVNQIEAKVGSVDVLINNAGIVRYQAFQDFTFKDIQDILNVNLIASMELARLLLPSMVARDSGHILNIASLTGKKGHPYDSIYSASKAGLIRWGDAVRQELAGTNVEISTVCPAYIQRVGMMVKTDIPIPSITLSVKPSKVAHDVIKAIKQNQAEVLSCRGVVATWVTKISFALSQFMPRLGDFFSRLLKVPELNRQRISAHITQKPSTQKFKELIR